MHRVQAFLLGNEGQGLNPDEISLCDWFVYGKFDIIFDHFSRIF